MKIPSLRILQPSVIERERISKTIAKLRTIFSIPFLVFGSIAKDTYLKNHREIDLFFKGPSIEEMMAMLKDELSSSKAFFKVLEKRRGHPYYMVSFKYLNFIWTLDLVPFTGIKEKSEVERSSLHVDLITSEINAGMLSSSHVRFFKDLFKRYQLYGAQSSIEGLSGYAIEVLCINSITIEDVLVKLKQEILLDPCDSNRNLYSSFSDSNRLRSICLLGNLKKVLKKSYSPLIGKIYCLKATVFDNELAEQVRKRMKKVVRELEKTVDYYGSYWDHEKQVLFLLLEKWVDYAEITDINTITTARLFKVNPDFYLKNKGAFNLSNIGSPRISKKKLVNFDRYFQDNRLVKIKTTSVLKKRFLMLSIIYIT